MGMVSTRWRGVGRTRCMAFFPRCCSLNDGWGAGFEQDRTTMIKEVAGSDCWGSGVGTCSSSSLE